MKKISFPLVMTVISLAAFVVAYSLTLTAVKPLYIEGLILALPFLIFGGLTLLLSKYRGKATLFNAITAALIPILTLSSGYAFVRLAVKSAVTEVTDTKYYARALEKSSYSSTAGKSGVDFFPRELTDEEVLFFSFTPQFLQGGESLYLGIAASAESIDEYERYFLSVSKCQERYGDRFEKSLLCGSDTAYIIYDEGYLPDSRNHGSRDYAVICRENGAVLFCHERW